MASLTCTLYITSQNTAQQIKKSFITGLLKIITKKKCQIDPHTPPGSSALLFHVFLVQIIFFNQSFCFLSLPFPYYLFYF